ncbi:H-NS family nucleoid-associated regulatory protein [Pusillimonas sp. ANT_WB101]|uniref:H-NS histone family protein n=1 Tax=Pusillimonas sp. ANT_WB101 TaxID=2597356 RepID=UPI0011EFCF3B|nr:H-NS histone family protein [Pusillimonas sp. ANT_WB101]KAA0911878.1 H-NS histone family protein [Pusillimonas sp. ANT_WB101]
MTRDTYTALKQKIEKEIVKLQKQAQALQEKRRGPIITSIVQSMREYEITPEEIAAVFSKTPTRKTARKSAAPAPKAVKRTVPPKYRNPETGDTWTGRGKAPRWISAAESEGKSRDQFLIQN